MYVFRQKGVLNSGLNIYNFENEVFLYLLEVRPYVRTRHLAFDRQFRQVRIDLSTSNFKGLFL